MLVHLRLECCYQGSVVPGLVAMDPGRLEVACRPSRPHSRLMSRVPEVGSSLWHSALPVPCSVWSSTTHG